MSSMQEMTTTKFNIELLKDEIMNSYDKFVDFGIPIASTIIPFSIFLLSPDEETGTFLLGVLFLTIIVLSSKIRQTDTNVKLNTDNTIGICIGYLVGYFIMNHINNSKPGSLISSIIAGVILLLIFSNNVSSSLFFGYFFGIVVGLCFSHLYYKKKINKQKLKEN